MTGKLKVENILSEFLDRNKDYAVSGQIKNGINGNMLSDFLIPIDRKTELSAKEFLITSNASGMEHINSISVPYDDVLACYEEADEYNQQIVYVILKSSMVIEFECVGLVL